MAYKIRRAEYFRTTVIDQPGEGFRILSQLAEQRINLLAFTGMPVGEMRIQLTLFPEDPSMMAAVARRAGLDLDGPHAALLVQGDDELGAFARIHRKLHEAGVNVYASGGLADGKGSFFYILYIRAEEFDSAAGALGL
jgi:hypothetical protein